MSKGDIDLSAQFKINQAKILNDNPDLKKRLKKFETTGYGKGSVYREVVISKYCDNFDAINWPSKKSDKGKKGKKKGKKNKWK